MPTIESRRLLTPLRDTAVVVGIVLAAAAAGALLRAEPAAVPSHRRAIPAYLLAMALDWSLYWYVWASARRSGTRLLDAIGARWPGRGPLALDLAVAAPFWFLWEWTALLVHRLLGPSPNGAVAALLPQTALEIGIWMAVCLTAGFCEEAVFRGYLQTQFRVLTGSTAGAIALQSALFGLAHAYQGWKNVIVIAVLGVLYGVLAAWRGNVRSAMLSHAWSDVFSGLRLRMPFGPF